MYVCMYVRRLSGCVGMFICMYVCTCVCMYVCVCIYVSFCIYVIYVSIDGVGAYDHVSRLAMLQALRDTPDACRVLPYVRLWYSTPSAYVWIDGNNCPHRVTQAEGGEQGDPLMPALFSLGMHRALTALQTELQPGERVFAFLDDLYIVAAPERVRTLLAQVPSWLKPPCVELKFFLLAGCLSPFWFWVLSLFVSFLVLGLPPGSSFRF